MSGNRDLIVTNPSQIFGTHEPGISRCPVKKCPHLIRLPDDGVLLAWLTTKTGKTQSWKTHVAYHTNALYLRSALREHGYDLLMDLSDDQVLAGYLLIVQQWAGSRAPGSHLSGPIAAATYNNRLAAISSLFDYARKQRLYKGSNPIELIERRTVHAYTGAHAIEMVEMRQLLARIARTTLAGKRDYALLSVALQTAGRGQALADLYVRDLSPIGERLKVSFPRTKGAKTSSRVLEVETSAALRDYLQQLYGPDWQEARDKPVWVSLSRNGSYGEQLSIQAVGQIYEKHLGISRSHVTRHTTAYALAKLGVPINEIQEILDHENAATTGGYIQTLKKAENKHGRDLEQVFGIRATPFTSEKEGSS